MTFGIESLKMPMVDRAVASRRETLFRETPAELLRRWALGTAWALRPHRIGGLPALGRMWARDLLARDAALPDPERALDNPSGLAGIAHDLSVPRLVEAYRRGLYPWAHVGPLKWWSLPERCVLFFDEIHIAKRLRARLRQARYRVTFDRDFEGVMKACAKPREGKFPVTWITPKIMRAYAELYDAGYAHSFEVWNEAGELAGGGYGVAVNGVFTTESQFAGEANTSKIGYTLLNWHLAKWGFTVNDNKGPTSTVLDMGFRVIPRSEFLAILDAGRRLPEHTRRWEVEDDLKTVAEWKSK